MQYIESLIPHLNATLALKWEEQKSSDPSNYSERHLESWSRRYQGRDLKQVLICKKIVLGWAQRDKDLDFSFERLCYLQELLLERLVSFRQSEAICRWRRYLYFEGLEEMFKRKLIQDSTDLCDPLARGLRLYLDIIHFHPFEDGNSRAAYLWLNYVMAQSGQGVPSFGKIGLMTTLPCTQDNYKLLFEFCKKQQNYEMGSKNEVAV